MTTHTRARGLIAVAAFAAAAFLAGCELPPQETVQRGYRGTGMVEVYNPSTFPAKVEANKIPEDLPAPPPGGPTAKATYKNVQVLGDLSVAEFTRAMVSITNWVSPQQSCTYCHAGADFAADDLYTKVVARRMLQMTRHINGDWKSHVAGTGVTCYTCHRGNPVPSNIWTADPRTDQGKAYAGRRDGQNAPSKKVALAALPNDPFSTYLSKAGEIQVVSTTPLPSGSVASSTQQTEGTYGLMMHFSQALGVNCTYCHNSRSFAAWDQSTPQRATAWHGIRMVRDLNANYLEPLGSAYPPDRKGPLGDAPKANCATCHQGDFKPLLGESMVKTHPYLVGPSSPGAQRAAAPAVAASGVLAKILFDVGKQDIDSEGRSLLAGVVKSMQGNGTLKVAISGYADRTGNPNANLELAKQRAFAVRDALKAAGIAEDRVVLKRPEFAVGGTRADSRRVDVSAM